MSFLKEFAKNAITVTMIITAALGVAAVGIVLISWIAGYVASLLDPIIGTKASAVATFMLFVVAFIALLITVSDRHDRKERRL
jgi:hypothetical protein